MDVVNGAFSLSFERIQENQWQQVLPMPASTSVILVSSHALIERLLVCAQDFGEGGLSGEGCGLRGF